MPYAIYGNINEGDEEQLLAVTEADSINHIFCTRVKVLNFYKFIIIRISQKEFYTLKARLQEEEYDQSNRPRR